MPAKCYEITYYGWLTSYGMGVVCAEIAWVMPLPSIIGHVFYTYVFHTCYVRTHELQVFLPRADYPDVWTGYRI